MNVWDRDRTRIAIIAVVIRDVEEVSCVCWAGSEEDADCDDPEPQHYSD